MLDSRGWEQRHVGNKAILFRIFQELVNILLITTLLGIHGITFLKKIHTNMANRFIKLNKKITNSMVSGLLWGSCIALTVSAQASQQPSRDSRTLQPRKDIPLLGGNISPQKRKVQGNRERQKAIEKPEPTGIPKEIAKNMSHEDIMKMKEKRKKRQQRGGRL
jgi:hypothetical protein